MNFSINGAIQFRTTLGLHILRVTGAAFFAIRNSLHLFRKHKIFLVNHLSNHRIIRLTPEGIGVIHHHFNNYRDQLAK
jgi:hypothetical protein